MRCRRLHPQQRPAQYLAWCCDVRVCACSCVCVFVRVRLRERVSVCMHAVCQQEKKAASILGPDMGGWVGGGVRYYAKTLRNTVASPPLFSRQPVSQMAAAHSGRCAGPVCICILLTDVKSTEWKVFEHLSRRVCVCVCVCVQFRI